MKTSYFGWIFGCSSSLFSIITAIIFLVLLYFYFQLNTELNQINTELLQVNNEVKQAKLMNQGLTFERDNLLAYKQQTNCGYNLPLDYQLNGQQLMVPMLTFVRNLPEVSKLVSEDIIMKTIDEKLNIKYMIFPYIDKNKFQYSYQFLVYPSRKGIYWINKACWIDPIDTN